MDVSSTAILLGHAMPLMGKGIGDLGGVDI
jgi:hypothetical protein